MLLRSSRVAGQLTKEALLGKALVGAGKGLLGFAGRHPMKVLGAGAVGASAAPEISKGLQQSKMGLRPQYLQAANEGLVPSVPRFQ